MLTQERFVLPDFDRGFLATYLRPQRPRLVLLAVILFSSIGLELANPQLARVFIDEAQAGVTTQRLLHIAIAFLAVAIAAQIASVVETYVAEDLGWRTTNALRADLTRHVLSLDDSFHSEHGAGELIERIDGDVSAIADFFARFVVHVLGSAVFLLGVLALLWLVDWRIGAVMTLCSLAAAIFMTRGGRFVGARSREARHASAALSACLEERLAGLPDIKANGADSYVLRRLHQHLADRFRTGRRSALATSMFSNTVGALFVAGAAGALATSVWLQHSGAISLGAVFLVFRYTGMVRVPLERLSRHMNSFQQAMGGIVRVRELLDTEPRVVDGERSDVPGGPLSVELDHVSFAYDRERVIAGISLRIEAGDVLGLLGRTGCGKTTLSRLLFRLHDVTDGAVRLGGVDVRDVRVDALRARVALVPQDVQILDGTVRDNVTLYDDAVSDARLRAVFEALELDDWLCELSDGLDTVLGATGRGLSAGEAQLLALTRAFMKDPGLVVLDEASSRLDPHTEQLLERAIARLLENRTAIVIAHRLTTVQRADEIVILDAGKVVEAGRRDDLVRDGTTRFATLLRTGLQEALR